MLSPKEVVTISSSMNNPSGEGADFSVRLARQFDDEQGPWLKATTYAQGQSRALCWPMGSDARHFFTG
jgi:hypothetical protein